MGQGAGQAGVGVEFEAGNAIGPRKGVAHCGNAGVQWAGMCSAVFAMHGQWVVWVVGSVALCEGAGGAAQSRLRKALHAGRAQRLAGPAAANVTKTGPAQHAGI